MKKLFLLLALFPLLARAGFEGKYSGSGNSLSHKLNKKRTCAEIFLNFQRTEHELKILEGGYKCENLQASFDPFTLELRDGKIFAEGQELGTFDGQTLDLFFDNKEEHFTYHWHLAEQGGAMTYLEEWTDNGSPALTVRGELRPVKR